MPPGIRPLTEPFRTRERMADGLRPIAVALLFLMVWAATWSPAAMAASLSGIAPPQNLGLFEHGGEVPAVEESTQPVAQVRSGQQARQSTDAQAKLPASPSASPLLQRARRQSRRQRPAGTPPRCGPPRGRRRGRAPPR